MSKNFTTRNQHGNGPELSSKSHDPVTNRLVSETSAKTPLVPEKVIPGVVESLLPDPIEGYSARMVEEIPDQYYFMRCQVGRVVTKRVAIRDSVTREVIRTAEVPVFFLKGVGSTFGAALEMARHSCNGSGASRRNPDTVHSISRDGHRL